MNVTRCRAGFAIRNETGRTPSALREFLHRSECYLGLAGEAERTGVPQRSASLRATPGGLRVYGAVRQ